MRRTRSFAQLYFLRLKKPSHVDVDVTTPHAGMKSVKASTKTLLPLVINQSPEGLLRPCCKNLTKRDAEDGTRLFNPLTLPTLVVEHGALLTTLPVTPDTYLANAIILQMPIASQLIRNGYYMTRNRETTRRMSEETSELWKIPTPDGSSLTREFSPTEFATALQKLNSSKAPGPDQSCPNLYSMQDL